MRAGLLRHRITIEDPNLERNSFGEPVEQDADTVATVWAAAEPARGREFFDAQREVSENVTRFRIRHRSDVNETMRVVWGSKTFDIVAVIDVDGLGKELHLMCEERV